MSPLRAPQLVPVNVDAGAPTGPLEAWRQGLGHGGINSLPLPETVVGGVARLRPRLIRIFIQEFFRVYPDHGCYDWTRLDPYMAALQRTGARVMAALCIKPPPLYPTVNESVWRPTDLGEWQHLVATMVHRYSVAQPIVTHWEIGNEVDIGENGGSPYLITAGADYAEYYASTVEAVRRAYPQARVGGPAAASVHSPVVAGFLQECGRHRWPLDFVSWHLYHSDPALHLAHLGTARRLLTQAGLEEVEVMITEWSRRLFDGVSVEEDAFDPRRAAAIATTAIRFADARVDGSFYYHIWDQTCYADDFRPFFSPAGVANMLRHWNEVPHRLGMFGVAGEARPQYFVYWMLSRLGSQRLASHSGHADVATLAGSDETGLRVLLSNYSVEGSADRVAELRYEGLPPGVKHLSVWRIDGGQRWDGADASLRLRPTERREVDTNGAFQCQVWLPGDSVALVELRPAPTP